MKPSYPIFQQGELKPQFSFQRSKLRYSGCTNLKVDTTFDCCKTPYAN